MTIDNGGPVYPGLHPSKECRYSDPGMNLLDYFAGEALQGICASGPTADYSDEKIANESYNLAEAMLKVKRQRSKACHQ